MFFFSGYVPENNISWEIYLQCVDRWKILKRVFICMEKDIETHVAENRKKTKKKR